MNPEHLSEEIAERLDYIGTMLSQIANRPAETMNINLTLSAKGVEAKLDGILSVLLDLTEQIREARKLEVHPQGSVPQGKTIILKTLPPGSH